MSVTDVWCVPSGLTIGENRAADVHHRLAELTVGAVEARLFGPGEDLVDARLSDVRDLEIGECRAGIDLDLRSLEDHPAVVVEDDCRVLLQRHPRRNEAADVFDLDDGDWRRSG